MAFVKLDTGILNSTLWEDRDVVQIFLTALLMAEPYELKVQAAQIEVRTMNLTGFVVLPGWYGFVKAAGVGIIRRALMNQEHGYIALEKLGSEENESRSSDFGGRRLVRVDGGYIVLNYMKYRDQDHTAKDRQKRLRDRKKALRHGVTSRDDNVTPPVTSRIADSREQMQMQMQMQMQSKEGEPMPPGQPALNHAAKIIEELGMTESFQNKFSIDLALKALVRDGKSLESAHAFLIAQSRDALERGEVLDRFWFEDQKWKRNTNGKQSKRTQEFEAVRKRIEEADGQDADLS